MKISELSKIPNCYYKYKPGVYFKYVDKNYQLYTYIGVIYRRGVEPKQLRSKYSEPYIKFYYKDLQTGKREAFWETSHIERKSKILSKDEVKRRLDAIPNNKHRFMIAFMYSTGLRVSELVNFKVKDLELDKKI